MSNPTTPNIKAGRKPISQKPRAGTNLSYDELFGNNLTISPELKAELDAKGLVPRWVDARIIKDFGGYHPKGWTIYKRDKTNAAPDGMEFTYGSDPAGIIRRGSVVLAVKSKEQAEKHRGFLDQRAKSYQNIHQEKADELRQFAKANRLNSQISEGYDEDVSDGD